VADELNEPDNEPLDPEKRELSDRRDFLRSLGKWSTAAIAAILLTESSPSGEASGWVNGRGSCLNRGGGGRVNRAGSWANGGGSWLNAEVTG
jgi:hypothetical protein